MSLIGGMNLSLLKHESDFQMKLLGSENSPSKMHLALIQETRSLLSSQEVPSYSELGITEESLSGIEDRAEVLTYHRTVSMVVP